MPVLVDTVVLSNLAAAKCLDLLRTLHDTAYVASGVYEEIQQGIQEGYAFLEVVDDAFTSGVLHLVTLDPEQEWRLYRTMPHYLHRGEAMSLAIASSRGWRFLTDDWAARRYARQINVSSSGTLGLLLYAVQQGEATVEQANAWLQTMIDRAHYRSPVTDLRLLIHPEQ